MTSLASLLGRLVTELQVHPTCRKVTVVETKEFSFDQFFLKIRAELAGDYKLQVRVYYNRGHVDYAYQFFGDLPIMRWDNKEEFHHLATFPHHYHDMNGNVKPSALAGNPIMDMKTVLNEIGQFISAQEN